MRVGPTGRHSGRVDVPRRLYRRPDRGIAGGVATGIALHIGLPVRLVRIAFVVMATAGGLGVALYGAYLIVVPPEPGHERGRFPPWLEYLVAGLAACAALAVAAAALPKSGLFVPTLLGCLGSALIWRQASAPERVRLRELSRASLSAGTRHWSGRVRVVAGAALVVAAAAIVLARADVTAVRDGALAVVVATAGLALITGPWWIRMAGQLSDERTARVRSQERADLAAAVHDSVLQTLALIQRNAASPREVARLARSQERTLRDLLYGSTATTPDTAASGGTPFGTAASGTTADGGSLTGALRAAAGGIEDDYGVHVDLVVVGDTRMDDPVRALVSATREAALNAAKHAGVDRVSVYVEVEQDAVSAYVKDRGVGFDPASIPADRQGVRGSVVGRVERYGGTADIRSAPGDGTEVSLRLPLTAVASA